MAALMQKLQFGVQARLRASRCGRVWRRLLVREARAAALAVAADRRQQQERQHGVQLRRLPGRLFPDQGQLLFQEDLFGHSGMRLFLIHFIVTTVGLGQIFLRQPFVKTPPPVFLDLNLSSPCPKVPPTNALSDWQRLGRSLKCLFYTPHFRSQDTFLSARDTALI